MENDPNMDLLADQEKYFVEWLCQLILLYGGYESIGYIAECELNIDDWQNLVKGED